jgi:hypothetical protein
MSPDRESVKVDPFPRGFLPRNHRFLQCPTGLFQALISGSPPKNTLPSELFCLKFWIAVDPRDTKQLFDPELLRCLVDFLNRAL